MKRLLLCLIAVSVLSPVFADPPTTPTQSSTAVFGKTSNRAISKEVWISARTDGKGGSGTAEDPFDGHTSALLDKRLRDYYQGGTTNLTIHLGTGTFETQGGMGQLVDSSHGWKGLSGWKIIGANREGTILKQMLLLAGSGSAVIYAPDADNFEVRNLTINCNLTALLPSISSSAQFSILAIGARSGTVDNVLVLDPGGSALAPRPSQESFTISMSAFGGTNPPEKTLISNCVVRMMTAEAEATVFTINAGYFDNGTVSGYVTDETPIAGSAVIRDCWVEFPNKDSLTYNANQGIGYQIGGYKHGLIQGNYCAGGSYQVWHDTFPQGDLIINGNTFVGAGVVPVSVIGNATTAWVGTVIISDNCFQTGGGNAGIGLTVDPTIIHRAQISNNDIDLAAGGSAFFGPIGCSPNTTVIGNHVSPAFGFGGTTTGATFIGNKHFDQTEIGQWAGGVQNYGSTSTGATSFAARQDLITFTRADLPATQKHKITGSWSGIGSDNTFNLEVANSDGTTSPILSLIGDGGETILRSSLRLTANQYVNFGTTDGSSGYGMRDLSGVIQFKNSGGSWLGLGTVASKDTGTSAGNIPILDGSGKLVSAVLPASATAYKGVWNANTNSPSLSNGSGTSGDFYYVSVAGSTSLDGTSSWSVGDQVVSNATPIWQRVPAASPVTSVAGKTGAVTLAAGDIASGTMATARLGSGSADSTSVLYGDQTYKVLTNASVGLGNVDNTADDDKDVDAARTLWDGSNPFINADSGVLTLEGYSSVVFATGKAALFRAGLGLAASAVTDTTSATNVTTGTFQNLPSSVSTLSYAATTNIPFATVAALPTLTLAGNVTFTTTGLAAGSSTSIRIVCDSSARTFIFPAGWTFLGTAAPSGIAAGKTAILSLTSYTTANSGVVAAYAVQP